jgi:hypothetical protein
MQSFLVSFLPGEHISAKTAAMRKSTWRISDDTATTIKGGFAAYVFNADSSSAT